ncbi:hypothetical protein J6590_095607, partial [Homalodisca vitripennis]
MSCYIIALMAVVFAEDLDSELQKAEEIRRWFVDGITEESQYDDVTQPNFPNFDGGRPSELHAVNKNGNYFMKNIGSQELFIPPTCLIEWENCKMDGDCCRPFFCSTLPRFPIIENMNESSTLQIDQFCSRFQLNVLLDWKTNNRKDLQKIIDSYK